MPANKDIKPIQPEEILKATRTFHGKDYRVQWRGMNLVVKKLLSMDEMAVMFSDIMNECTIGINEVAYILLDYSFRKHVILYYSNAILPDNPDDINYIIYETDLFDTVCSHANSDQVMAIKKSIGL